MFYLRFERDEWAMLANPINGFDQRSEVYVDASILWGLVLNPWLSPNRIVIWSAGVRIHDQSAWGRSGPEANYTRMFVGGSKAISHFSSWGVFFTAHHLE